MTPIAKEYLFMLCDITLKQSRMVDYTSEFMILHVESGQSLPICKLHRIVVATSFVPTSEDPSQQEAEAAA